MKPFCLLPAFSVSLLCGASAAHGQTSRPERPYRGLFGGGVDGANKLLTANASLGGGYDDNVLADAHGGGVDPVVRKAGSLGQFAGELTYSASGDRLTAGASVGSSLRYYPSVTNPLVQAHTATAGASWRLGDGATITVNQAVARQPVAVAAIFPAAFELQTGEGTLPDFDVVLSRNQYLAYGGGVVLTQQISRRLSLFGNYAYQIRNSTADFDRFTSQRAGFGVRQRLTRNLGLRLAYAHQQADYASRDPFEYHELDIGIDFDKALSVSRRTTLSFSSGSFASKYANEWHYQATGSARLNHEIGRSWNASLAYRRDVFLVETLEQPVFGDSATFQLGGLLNRRVQIQSSVRAFVGDAGFTGKNGLDQYHGAIGVSIALSRYVSLGVDGSFYHYRFDSGVLLPPGVPRHINRQSVRAHVDMWALLLRRPRTNRVAR